VLPEQIVVAEAEVETVGKALMTIVCVIVLLPFAFVAINVTVLVPAVAHVTPVGFCKVEVPGVPPGKVQAQLVGDPVEMSVKLTAAPTQALVGKNVKSATGGAPAGA
jgi:hypothetical protein